MANLEVRIKLKGEGLALPDELALRHRFQDEIEKRDIGKGLGGGSGLGGMDIGVEVTSDVTEAKSKLRELAEELGIGDGLIIEEQGATEGAESHRFGKLIYSYSRAQAIEDGVLVDVSEVSLEAGIIFPVALTAAVFEQYVKVPQGLEGLQDESGRLWDIVHMLRLAIFKCESYATKIPVKLHVQNDRSGPKPVELKAHCGPGDDGEPVITIMLLHED